MEHQSLPNFDDPSLKKAVCRCFGCECAPPGLRDRVVRSLRDYETETSPAAIPLGGGAQLSHAATSATSPGSGAMAMPTWSALPGFALAAVFVVAVGSVAFFLAGSPQSLPHSFELAAVRRHDMCCDARDHHAADVPQEGFARIGEYLRQELSHPVLAANMVADGWQFRGAAICPVGDVDSAHLLFAKDDRTLSVFSLPASMLPTLVDNESYEGTLADHSIVVRRADGALYCMVGRGPGGNLTAQELDKLLRKHEPEATVAQSPGPRISVAGIVREK